MNYIIREMKDSEVSILEDFLYEAIYIPEGVISPPKSIINEPELQVYIKKFGYDETDIALVAEVNGIIVGAVWARIMNDYGHIDNETPSLAISLLKKFRNKGIGTQLMKKILVLLKDNGFKRASLSVQKENYATKMYLNLGFRIIKQTDEEYLMVIDL